MEKDPGKSRAFGEICRLAGQAVGRYDLIRAGDRLLLGVSGGKDSLTLAHVLHYMKRRSPVRFELELATFDPMFPDFGMAELEAYCREQKWRLHITRLDIGELIREKGFDNPCMICSRLRRGKLYGQASELGCNKLVLAQHLDDAIVSLLMSLARGQGITTMGPNVAAREEHIRIIRPLIMVPEPLIVESAAGFNFPNSGKCSFAERLEADGDRAYFKRLLVQMEQRIPHIRSQMLRSMSHLEPEYLLDPAFLDFNGEEVES